MLPSLLAGGSTSVSQPPTPEPLVDDLFDIIPRGSPCKGARADPPGRRAMDRDHEADGGVLDERADAASHGQPVGPSLRAATSAGAITPQRIGFGVSSTGNQVGWIAA